MVKHGQKTVKGTEDLYLQLSTSVEKIMDIMIKNSGKNITTNPTAKATYADVLIGRRKPTTSNNCTKSSTQWTH